MMPVEDDPARATVRVAESVVALARAELALALAKARVSGFELFVTFAMTAAAAFLAGLAAIVIVFSPVLWAYRPSAAIGSLGIAVALALFSSFLTLRRWRARSRSRAGSPTRTEGLAETEIRAA